MGDEFMGVVTGIASDVGEIKGALTQFMDAQKTINEEAKTRMGALERFKFKIALLCLGSSTAGGGLVHGITKWLNL